MFDPMMLMMMLGKNGLGGLGGSAPEQPQEDPSSAYPMMTRGGGSIHKDMMQSPLFSGQAAGSRPEAPGGGQFSKTLGGTMIDPELAKMPILGATGIQQPNAWDRFGQAVNSMPQDMRIMMGLSALPQLGRILGGNA